jgi:Carboxypeptidase regulatory-like domain
MPMRGFWTVLAAFFLLVAAPAGFAQKGASPTRSLQGVVSSPEDKPVSGAVVQLKDLKTLQIRSFISQPQGNYRFQGLSPDRDYEVKAESHGMSSDTKTLSSFDSRKQAVINLKLNPKK